MYVFGGILELTKELDDLFSFDFTSRKITQIGECTVTAAHEEMGMTTGMGEGGQNDKTLKQDESPLKKTLAKT